MVEWHLSRVRDRRRNEQRPFGLDAQKARMASGLDFARTFGTYLLQRNLQHLIIHVTNHCNFRCEHCFIDFSPKKDLKLPQFQEIARQVGPLFWLDIAGGEPSLRKDLADIVAAFDAKVVQIPSNGSLPDLLIPALERIKTADQG